MPATIWHRCCAKQTEGVKRAAIIVIIVTIVVIIVTIIVIIVTIIVIIVTIIVIIVTTTAMSREKKLFSQHQSVWGDLTRFTSFKAFSA